MSDIGGLTLDRKNICVSHGRAATVVATLAEALGHRVTRGGHTCASDVPCDLWVVQTDEPEALAPYVSGPPTLVVAPRRLRTGQSQRLFEAGAQRVLDVEACLLEVTFSLTELLFGTCCEQKRYAEAYGRVPVTFTDEQGVQHRGCLTGIAQRGGQVLADAAPIEGAMVTLQAEVGPWLVPIRSRVAYVDDQLRPGFCVEFALEQQQLAPRIASFLCESTRPQPSSGATPSRVSA